METDSEKVIEKTLVTRVKRKGGQALKFVSPGNKGVPDRIVLLPGARLFFIELKTTGKTLDPLQEYWQRVLIALGFKHLVIDTLKQLHEFFSSENI